MTLMILLLVLIVILLYRNSRKKPNFGVLEALEASKNVAKLQGYDFDPLKTGFRIDTDTEGWLITYWKYAGAEILLTVRVQYDGIAYVASFSG